jgi:signal peptidase I
MRRPTRIIILLIACSLVSSCTLFNKRTIKYEGTSMLPGIKDGDKLKVQRLDATTRTQLVRGDIIVFKYPADPTRRYVKRVIGLPADQIEIKTGQVWLNGVKLDEPYVSSRLNLSQRSQPPVTVPAHAYYVLGDNRDNSSDSRIWGMVPEELIVAKVVRE